jgi:hypothetical protein
MPTFDLTPEEFAIVHIALNTTVEHWKKHAKESPGLERRITEMNKVKDKLIAIVSLPYEPMEDATKQ